ncbi:DUF922 domain-containing protein [Polluticoccus soli]|uniref:DUF922 domain-containing protein n=1 Tax=Polluticoccus soli TaxID=3034150 RepID=UPI0023E1199B|nr:hypothetical protein [Flavipsychrobacter sp. JY13-12]
MKRTLLALLCLAPSLCFAQSITVNGKEGYHKLTWNDYRGAADTTKHYPAMTHCNITWKVDTTRAKQNKTAFPPLKVVVGFTDRSWVNTEREATPAALRHQRGHFDIAVVCAADLQQKFNDTTFDVFENAMPAITRMYQETLAKYERMRKRYATVTANGKNTKEQATWDTYLDKEITRCLKPPVGS